jgi:50S ribosomal protein L16 3-hydroxylase
MRFCDPDLGPSNGDGEIDDAAFARVLRAMPWLRAVEVSRSEKRKKNERGAGGCSGDVGSSLLRTWFPRFITRYRSAHTAMPRARKLTDAQFESAFARQAVAMRNPWSRAAWIRSGRDAMLFVAGTDHTCSIPFARLVCSRTAILLDRVRSRRDRDALRSLIDLGHVTLATTRRSRQ